MRKLTEWLSGSTVVVAVVAAGAGCDLFDVAVDRPNVETLLADVTVGTTPASFVAEPLPRTGTGAAPVSRGAYYLTGPRKLLVQVQPADAPGEVLVGMPTDPTGHFVASLTPAQLLQPVFCIVVATDPEDHSDPFRLSVGFRGQDVVSQPAEFAFGGLARSDAGTGSSFCTAGYNACLAGCANPWTNYGLCASQCRLIWNCSGDGGPAGDNPIGLDPTNPIDSVPPDLSVVPFVTGSPIGSASATILAVDLQVGSITRAARPGTEPGTVIEQAPAAGTQVAIGSTVDLTISAPVIPDVVGRPIAQARSELASAGFTVGAVAPTQAPQRPAGAVVSQSPSANTVAQPGAPVDITVATEVRIERIWSDQFEGIEMNYLPGGAGRIGTKNGYVLMGTRDGRVSAEATVVVLPNDPDVRSRVLFRLVRVGSDTSEGVGVSLAGDVVALSTIGGLSTADYFVVGGVDTNGDGQLYGAEEYRRSPWRLRSVPQAVYDVDRAFLSLGSNLFPNRPTAQEFARSFLRADFESAITLENVEYSFEYISLDEVEDFLPLDHNVGLLFLGSVPTLKSFVFPASSSIADSVLTSDLLNDVAGQILLDDGNRVRTDYEAVGRTLFSWTLAAPLGFYSDEDPDLYFALGNAHFDLRITALVHCSAGRLTTSIVTVGGSVLDLYDWNYDLGVDTNTRMARVQAGYGTLGLGGNVFRVQIDLSGPLSGLVVDFGPC